MNVKELKKQVKERGCVGYSSLKKQELIDILKSEDCGKLSKKKQSSQKYNYKNIKKEEQSPQKYNYKNMNVKGLKEQVKERGCIGYSSLKKQELINVLKSEDCGNLSKNIYKEQQPLKNVEKYRVFTKKELEQKSFSQLQKLGDKYGYKNLPNTKKELIQKFYYKTIMNNFSLEEFLNFTKKVKWAIISKNDCSLCNEIENMLMDKKIRFIGYTVMNKREIEYLSKKYGDFNFPIILNYKKLTFLYNLLSQIEINNSLTSLPDIDLNIRKKNLSKITDKPFKGEGKYIYNIMRYFTWVYEKTNCAVIDKYNIFGYNINDNVFIVYPNFYNEVRKCYKSNNYRFIIIFFGIFYSDLYNSHATVLIYDKNLKEMELFDPNGVKLESYKELSLKIQKIFNKNIDENMVKKFYQPIDFCPVGLQYLQHNERKMIENKDPGGFCASWIFWYIELRLSNSDVSRQKILDYATYQMVMDDKKSLTEFIRDYSKFLSLIIEGFKSHKYQTKTIPLKDYVMSYVESKDIFVS